MSDSTRDMTKNKIPFKLLEKSEQDKLLNVGKENCLYYDYDNLLWDEPRNKNLFRNKIVYRIREDYQEKPVAFSCGIYKGNSEGVPYYVFGYPGRLRVSERALNFAPSIVGYLGTEYEGDKDIVYPGGYRQGPISTTKVSRSPSVPIRVWFQKQK